MAAREATDTVNVTDGTESHEVGTSALESLVRSYHGQLVGLAYVLTGSSSDAEDLVSQAYLSAWPALASGAVISPLPYLKAAVVNRASNWRRHRFHERMEAMRAASEPEPLIEQPPSLEERDLLWPAVLRLPMPQRQVVVLRYLEGYSERECATVLGIPVGTVKSRGARALRSLHEALSESERP